MPRLTRWYPNTLGPPKYQFSAKDSPASGRNIFTDLGAGMVKVPRRLIVYREEPITHPVTGKILGSDNIILGRLRVTQVMEDLSKTKLQEGNAAEIKLLDKVVTE